MRLRRNPLAKQRLRDHPLVVQDPEQLCGKWKTVFPLEQPLPRRVGHRKRTISCQSLLAIS